MGLQGSPLQSRSTSLLAHLEGHLHPPSFLDLPKTQRRLRGEPGRSRVEGSSEYQSRRGVSRRWGAGGEGVKERREGERAEESTTRERTRSRSMSVKKENNIQRAAKCKVVQWIERCGGGEMLRGRWGRLATTKGGSEGGRQIEKRPCFPPSLLSLPHPDTILQHVTTTTVVEEEQHACSWFPSSCLLLLRVRIR